MERIGIDTHGYDEPPDEPELSDDELGRMADIVDEINKLVDEHVEISHEWPSITGYVRKSLRLMEVAK